MKKHKFNVVGDGQWGSTGKGLMASYLGREYFINSASTTNGPNAGHTAVIGERKFISKILPVTAINDVDYPDDNKPIYWIGPTASFKIPQLMKEIEECGVARDRIKIHPRAIVVTDNHATQEQSATEHIGSTMQGTGAAFSEKVMRGSDVKLAGDYEELADMIVGGDKYFPTEMFNTMLSGTHLHELAQGFSLSINHGSHYPQCTSRDCLATNSIADMGLPMSAMGDVYTVIRPYPIRVGNVVKDGEVIGYSGDAYPGQKEITWQEVGERAGMPQDEIDLLLERELTTVTKRVRRVFEFSIDQIKKAAFSNGTNYFALNFANYIDHSCYGMGGGIESYNNLPDKVKQFVEMIENETGVYVALVGTGPNCEHVINRIRGEVDSINAIEDEIFSNDGTAHPIVD